MSGFILKVDGTVVPLKHECSLEELQAAVGGWIERVKIAYDYELADMIVNEEGKLRDLPLNRKATELYWNGRASTDPIVGDVVVLLGSWKLK